MTHFIYNIYMSKTDMWSRINPFVSNGISPTLINFGPVHLRFTGWWVVFFILKILIIESIPQARTGVWSGSARFAHAPQKGCYVYMG